MSQCATRTNTRRRPSCGHSQQYSRQLLAEPGYVGIGLVFDVVDNDLAQQRFRSQSCSLGLMRADAENGISMVVALHACVVVYNSHVPLLCCAS